MPMTVTFDRFARRAAEIMGSATAFMVLCVGTLIWLLIGPLAHWSELWQITMTTTLTILTQASAMLIQATTNRQEKAMQTKLDELIRAISTADNRLRGIEEV
jgi:low affinity Fe/Cu permease